MNIHEISVKGKPEILLVRQIGSPKNHESLIFSLQIINLFLEISYKRINFIGMSSISFVLWHAHISNFQLM